MSTIPNDLYLDLPKVRAHLVDWGGPAEATSILLLHGAASNAEMWNPIARRLVQNFRVLALDQRSHGLTSAPTDNDFNFAAVCDDIQVICDRLQIESPILVGHSWGGNVALEYAAREPDATAGIVIVEGGFVGLNAVATWPQVEKMVTPARWDGVPLVKMLEQVTRAWGEHYSAEVLDEVMGNFTVRVDQTVAPHLSFENQRQIQHAVWEQDAVLYSKVSTSALFLWCEPPEPHDEQTKQILKWKRKVVAPSIRAAMPHAQVEWISDSVHDVPLQRAQLLAEKIRSFAQEIAH